MRIDIEIQGAAAAERRLINVEARIQDLRPPFRRIAEELIVSERRRFAGAGRWAPLAPSTLRRKAEEGLPPRILVASGALQRSLTELGAPGQALRVERDQLLFGTEIFYATYHQKGHGVPKRKVIDLPRATRRQAIETIRDYIISGVA